MYELAKLDKETYSKFIENHFYLVKIIAKKYSSKDNFEDLFQEGCIGLIEAFEKFDINKGAKFSSYARFWIRKNIQDYLWKTNLVKITRQDYLDNKAPKKETGEDFDIENILGISESENCFEKISKEEFRNIVRLKITKLNQRERDIIKLYFGIDCIPCSYKEIGAKFNTSKQRIHQILKVALKNIKETMEFNKDLFLLQ